MLDAIARGRALPVVFGLSMACQAHAEAPPDSGAAPAATPAPEALVGAPIAVAPDASTSPGPGANPGGDSPQQLAEIVVTATKRQKRLRDIPASITAISGDKLEDEGHLNLTDYVRDTPGVTVTEALPGLTRFSMRGVSTDTSPSSIIPSAVGFFIGDTAFTDPYIANVIPDLSAFDLDNVQVLRGPQGTLFGGSALSGAVRYELRDPVQGEWQVRAFGQAIQPDRGSLAFTEGGAVNVPLLREDRLALRVAYLHRAYPGVVDDTYTGEKDVDHGSGDQVRAILLWEPGSWRFKFTHLTQDFGAPNQLSDVDAISKTRTNGLNVNPHPVSDKFDMDTLEMGYAFDSMKLVSLGSRLAKKFNSASDATSALVGPPPQGYPEPLTIANSDIASSQSFSQEVRLQSTSSGPLEWLVGAYYYNYVIDFALADRLTVLQDLTGPSAPLGQVLDQIGIGTALDSNTTLLAAQTHSKSNEKAIFFDLTWKPWQSVELEGGARLYRTNVAGTLNGNGVLVRAVNEGPDVAQSADIVAKGINPRFTATWHFSHDDMVYAQAAKGFRFGGIQIAPSTATNGIPPTFKSDSLWNYELGLRTSWLHRSLNADVTGFYIRYKNPILQESAQGIPTGYLDNVASSISRGLETSLHWHTPLEGLSLSASAAFTTAYSTAPFTASGNKLIEPGQEMPGVAPQQYNGDILYLLPLGQYALGLSTGYNYIGKGFSDLQHDVQINGYGTLKAGVILSNEVWAWHPKLAFNVGNILNAVAATGGTVNTPLVPIGSFNTYFLNAPRTYTMRLSMDF